MIPSLSALQRRGVRLHHLRSVLVSLREITDQYRSPPAR
jgi:hypothetical protein